MNNVKKKYDYLIVGAGLCGLSLASKLSANNKSVLLLEKGGQANHLGSLLFAACLYDKGALARSIEGTIIYRAFGIGGTSLISCSNAVMPSQSYLDGIGLDITSEIIDMQKKFKVSDKSYPLGPKSLKIMKAANDLGYTTVMMPKFTPHKSCRLCGHCELGCKYGVKWTALDLLNDSKQEYITLMPGITVARVLNKNGKAVGVSAKSWNKIPLKFYADKIIISAGGIGTPVILQNSGIPAGERLFVDLFNVTYGYDKTISAKLDPPMNIICSQFHETGGYILSNFVDNPAGFASTVNIKNIPKILHIKKVIGIMTKIQDDAQGKVYADGKVSKSPTEEDKLKLENGSKRAKEILLKIGIKPENIFVTKPRGAHPGGTAAINMVVNDRLETQIKNLFVCDPSIFPESPGVPPMLTLLAVTAKFAKLLN